MTVLYPAALMGGKTVLYAEVGAALSTPWRTAQLRSVVLPDPVKVELGYQGGKMVTVFEAQAPDDLAADWRGRSENATVRGLPAWRREIGPQGFQDVRLETLLKWVAGACGGQIDVNVQGRPQRHYQVRRGPAHRVVQEALSAWRVEAALIELDGGVLHVGPESRSPHAAAGVQAQLVQGRNLYEVSDVGGGRYRLALPGMAWLRVAHRVTVKHDLVQGRVRITDVVHRWAGPGRTWLEVVT
ncbi:hypothetical protein [uncultured Deinococcus sp.]|uniref:hypothetical protein n=1 Tax=uncultured Deinococcus sp. TaxID=158789 RepID=UPI002588F6E9|nr:hypothetical protein [uncultured Deinococcus sp.]